MQQIFGNTVIAKHITQSFNALSQRTQIARFQSTGTTNAVATTDFTFDTANRLSGIAHKQGATNLNTYAYTYDPLSRIATIVSTLEGTDTYSYDQTSQLVGATHTSHANETYGFDANGNRNTSGFTTGTNNQTTAGLGFTFVYDDEGNRTNKTETSTGKVEEYTWDHRNRLTKVVFRNTSGGAIVKQVDYEYDAYNRLVRRTFDADGAGAGAATNQYWVYDEGINAVLQFDGSSASNLSHRYLWSDNVDELLANEQLTGSNTLWGLADHLGSLRDIADYSEPTGVTTIANHRTINSFGKLVSETNAAVDMLFAFTGKQFDEATGLQHNLFRWLDPTLAQWLNEDPIGFAAGDENVRRYVGNGVTRATDPSGLVEEGDGWINWLWWFLPGGSTLPDHPANVDQSSDRKAKAIFDQLDPNYGRDNAAAGSPTGTAGDVSGTSPGLRKSAPAVTSFAEEGVIWTATGPLAGARPSTPKGPLWTATKNKTGVENALDHFKKHGSDFPQYPNATQYAQGARNFVTNPPKGTLTKVRPNGDRLFYDPATNTFASQRADGALRTMFKPDPTKHGFPTNLDYFNAQ
jgi:RHS repeat-associated protein